MLGSIVGLNKLGNAIYLSGLKWVVMLAPLGIVFYMSAGINKMRASTAQTTFWVFAALMGLSLSSILLVYTGVSVTRVFFIASATFGAMSIYGYTTKRDLTKLGSFLMMGLIGIIIASVVNMFMKSSMMYFVISILGVLIFVGLTAYDTQKIKNMYAASDTGELMGKKAVMGALNSLPRLYKFIYNVVKIIWSKKIVFYFLSFFQLVFLSRISRSKEFFKILPLVSVIKYFRFLFLGLKFLQILYKAFSAAFLKTLKLTCLLRNI